MAISNYKVDDHARFLGYAPVVKKGMEKKRKCSGSGEQMTQ